MIPSSQVAPHEKDGDNSINDEDNEPPELEIVNDDNRVVSLLDYVPLNQDELQHLLHELSWQDTDSTYRNSDDDDNNNNSNHTMPFTVEFKNSLTRQYRQDLPELSLWIETAMQNEYVVTTAQTNFHDYSAAKTADTAVVVEHDNNHNTEKLGMDSNAEMITAENDVTTATNTASATPPAEYDLRFFQSIEAVVSLSGRRRQKGYDVILETMHSYFYRTDDPVEETSTGSTTAASHVPHLSSFVYRLCVCYLDICTHNNNSVDHHRRRISNLTTSSTVTSNTNHDTITPPEWDAYFAPKYTDGSLQTPPPPPPTLMEWKRWIQRYAPMIPVMISTVISYVFLFQIPPQPPSPIEHEHVCILKDRTNLPIWMTTITSIPMQLALMGLGDGVWRSIYQSTIHGLSFTTFTHQLLSYYGPTLVVIETTKNEIFGYYTKVPWKVSNRWYTQNNRIGDVDLDNDVKCDDLDESFLFRLYPSWNVYRPQNEPTMVPKRYHQYLNPPSVKNGHNVNHNALVGWAVGGVADNVPRLHITPSFEQCKACIWDSVFDSGPLLSNDDESYFDVFNLEVWAVTKCQYPYNHNGIDDSSCNDIYEQGKRLGEDRMSMMEHVRQRYAKVDRTQFVDDLIHGTVLPNKLFQHRLQTRGRADFVVASDNATDGYVIDGKQPSPR